MQDLLVFLVVVFVAVGGAEIVRAVCSKRLSAPVPVRDAKPAELIPVAVLAD